MAKKNKVIGGLLLAALAIGVVGGAYAYFTAQTKVEHNTFTISEHDPKTGPGEFTEPDWDPDSKPNLDPNEIKNKNPQYKHTAEWDAFVFMEVSIPVMTKADNTAANALVKNAVLPEGTPLVLINNKWNQNYFDVLTDQNLGSIGTLREITDVNGWSLIGCDIPSGDVTKDTKLRMLFSYTPVLKTGQSTGPVFDKFQVLNFNKYLAGADKDLSIDVQVHIMQSAGFESRTDKLALFKEVFPETGEAGKLKQSSAFQAYEAPTISITETPAETETESLSEGTP